MQGVLLIFRWRISAVAINNHSYEPPGSVQNNRSVVISRGLKMILYLWHFSYWIFNTFKRSKSLSPFFEPEDGLSIQFVHSNVAFNTKLKRVSPHLANITNDGKLLHLARSCIRHKRNWQSFSCFFFFLDSKEMNFWIASSNRNFQPVVYFMCYVTLSRSICFTDVQNSITVVLFYHLWLSVSAKIVNIWFFLGT